MAQLALAWYASTPPTPFPPIPTPGSLDCVTIMCLVGWVDTAPRMIPKTGMFSR
jgi:hypothetical protein